MFYLFARPALMMIGVLVVAMLAVITALRSQTATAVSFAQFEPHFGRAEIYLDPFYRQQVRVGSLRQFNIIFPTGMEFNPRSDDGRILTVQSTGRGIDIFVTDTNDDRRAPVTNVEVFAPFITDVVSRRRANRYPAWSPDGEWIVFVSTYGSTKRDLYIIRPDGSDLQLVRRDVDDSVPLQMRWREIDVNSNPLVALVVVVLVIGFVGVWMTRGQVSKPPRLNETAAAHHR